MPALPYPDPRELRGDLCNEQMGSCLDGGRDRGTGKGEAQVE
jgi:hypothetical protein